MFRVVLDLSCFFHNHKRKARVFVKDNVKTVADLQKRITEVFGVTNFELYACEGQCFLPPPEDIRVLRDDEIVSVIPIDKNRPVQVEVQNEKPQLEPQSSTNEKPKKSKRTLEIVIENNTDDLSSPKKKKKPKERYSNCSTSEDELPKKKKKKKNSRKDEDVDIIMEYEFQENIQAEETKNLAAEKSKTVEKKLSNKSLKMKSILPTLKSHIESCDKSGRSVSFGATSTSVRLSNHVDTSHQKFKKLEPIPTITDEVLNQKKINIVKIDIIKNGAEVNIGAKNISMENNPENNSKSPDVSTLKQNFVKEVVQYIEKKQSLSPEFSENTNRTKRSEIMGIEQETSHKYRTSDMMEVEQETPYKSRISKNSSILPSVNQTSNNESGNNTSTNKPEQLQTDHNNSNTCRESLENSKKSNSLNSYLSEPSDRNRSLGNSSVDSVDEQEKSQNACDMSSQNTKQLETSSDSLENSKKCHSAYSHVSDHSNRNKSLGDSSVDSLFELEKLQNTSDTSSQKTKHLETSSSSNRSGEQYNLENVSFHSYRPSASLYRTNLESSINSTSAFSDITDTPPSTDPKNKANRQDTPNINSMKNFFLMKRQLSGVAACLGQLRESNVMEPEINNDFVTKRSRKRVRNRRSKKSRDKSEVSTSDSSFVEPYVPKPMNVAEELFQNLKVIGDDIFRRKPYYSRSGWPQKDGHRTYTKNLESHKKHSSIVVNY